MARRWTGKKASGGQAGRQARRAHKIALLPEAAADQTRLEQVEVIFRALPDYNGTAHLGSRLAFGPDGMLYLTLGERSALEMRAQAQQLGSHMGKIIRIRPDGTAPSDNPFAQTPGALPEIWSLGHRNVEAAAFDSQGRRHARDTNSRCTTGIR